MPSPSRPPIDLARLTETERYSVALKTETLTEVDARLENDRAEAYARRAREDQLFKFGLGVTALMLVAATGATFLGSGELQRWGMSLVLSIVSACGGYAVGKSQKDK